MAIWAGSTINSNETANLINQLWNTKAIAMVRRKNGLLYELLGKAEPGATPLDVNWQRTRKVSGINVQFNLMGGLKTIETVGDGEGAGNETSTWGGTVIPSTIFGGVTLPLVHYADAEYFPSSELDRYQGDELRTRDWIAQKMEYLMLSWENTFGNSLATNTQQVPTRTQVCPWRHQISSGNTTHGGETVYRTYGLDRFDNGNADFRGNVATQVGDLTLKKIRDQKLECIERGGMATLGLCENAVYSKVLQEIEAYTTVNYDEMWSKFGGEYANFAGTRFVLETRMASGELGLLDPNSFVFWHNMKNFTRNGIVQDVNRRSTHVLVYEYWVALFCNKPNSNAVLTGINT